MRRNENLFKDVYVFKNMECEHCKKILSNKYNLERHKSKCKLASSSYKPEFIPIFICTGCNNIYKSSVCHSKHVICCPEYLKKYYKEQLAEKDKIITEKDKVITEKEKVIAEKEKVIAEKDKIIADIAKQPRTVTNNNRLTAINSYNNVINNLMSLEDLDTEYIREQMENNLTANHVYDGQKGIATFMAEHLAVDKRTQKQTLVCTDPSRHTFCYKTSGKIIKEKTAKPIINKIVTAGLIDVSRDKVEKVVEKVPEVEQDKKRNQYLDGYLSIKNIVCDGSEFTASLAKQVYSKSVLPLEANENDIIEEQSMELECI